MAEFNAIIIGAGRSASISIEPVGGELASAQAVVGGNVEGLRSGSNWEAYCNDEGKLKNLEPNYAATIFLSKVAGHNLGDVIAGTVLIVGIDEDGNAADVPEELTEALREILIN